MIVLRAATPGDAAQIAAIYAPFVAGGTISFETVPPDAAAMGARMASSNGLYPWIVATFDDAPDGVVGYAYAGQFRDRPAYRYVVETSVYVSEAGQRRGVGRLLYEALIDTLRAQDFTQAIGGIALPNEASIALHESVGFQRAGFHRQVGYKHGQWIDVGFWQCELNRPETPPRDPIPFTTTGVVRDKG